MTQVTFPANSKLKVNLEGESHNIAFEQPVLSVEFCDGSSVPLYGKALRTRNMLGSLLFIAVITIFYFANENTELRSEINKIKPPLSLNPAGK